MNFKLFAQQVKDNFDSMSTKPLYRTNVGQELSTMSIEQLQALKK